MKASEPRALEVGLQGPKGLHSERGSLQTAHSAVVTTAIQPFGVCGTEHLRMSISLTHLQSSRRLLAEAESYCSWMGRIASDSLRTHSLRFSPQTEARGPPLSGADQHTLPFYYALRIQPEFESLDWQSEFSGGGELH